MTPNATDPSQSPVRIKHDGEFYAKLLTKESSFANPSFRYYGAGPGSVPFVWESEPGMPKDVSRINATIPSITPPPSYQLRHDTAMSHKKSKNTAKNKKYKVKWIKIRFIAAIFRRLGTLGKARQSSSTQISSSTRWLFSSVATGVASTTGVEKSNDDPSHAVLCFRVRPSPWMVQFRGRRNNSSVDGWV